jgi:hypothetical protein
MVSAPANSPIETLSAKLRMVLLGLRAALGLWRLEPTVGTVLFGRIGATLGRIERLLARFRAGRLWRSVKVGPRGSGCRKSSARLPRRFGWLVTMAGSEAACYGLQLQIVLNAPEMAELLAASPQAGRILRPLCRALALVLPGVVTAEHGEREPRRRKLRVKPEPFRIPLPRGVLSAARRQGFGKMC